MAEAKKVEKKVAKKEVAPKAEKPVRKVMEDRTVMSVPISAADKEIVETEAKIAGKKSVAEFAREAVILYARLLAKLGKDKKIFIGKEANKVVEFKL